MIGVCHTGGHTPQSPWESLLQGTGADWDSGTGPLLSWRWTGGWALQLTQRVSGFTGGHLCRPRVFGSGERDCSSPSQCLWGGALGIWGWGAPTEVCLVSGKPGLQFVLYCWHQDKPAPGACSVLCPRFCWRTELLGPDGVWFGDLWISPLLFADAALLASSSLTFSGWK